MLPLLPHATDTPSPEPLRATLVDGTAASARTASDAASSFLALDIRVTSLRFEPLRTRLRAFGGSLTANYCDANGRLMRSVHCVHARDAACAKHRGAHGTETGVLLGLAFGLALG